MWPAPNVNGRQELEIVCGDQHIAFVVSLSLSPPCLSHSFTLSSPSLSLSLNLPLSLFVLSLILLFFSCVCVCVCVCICVPRVCVYVCISCALVACTYKLVVTILFPFIVGCERWRNFQLHDSLRRHCFCACFEAQLLSFCVFFQAYVCFCVAPCLLLCWHTALQSFMRTCDVWEANCHGVPSCARVCVSVSVCWGKREREREYISMLTALLCVWLRPPRSALYSRLNRLRTRRGSRPSTSSCKTSSVWSSRSSACTLRQACALFSPPLSLFLEMPFCKCLCGCACGYIFVHI